MRKKPMCWQTIKGKVFFISFLFMLREENIVQNMFSYPLSHGAYS